MTGPAIVVLAGGAALMAIVWWPTAAGSPASLLMGSVILAQRRSVRVGPVVAVLVMTLGFAAGVVLFGAVTGAAGLVLVGVCVWSVAVQFRSRRSLRESDELAQLTNSLANQALVAPTVVEAIRQAAPLIPGRVGTAAQQMAAECETGGLVEAANRFATTVQRPIAEMLATVLAEAFRGGSQWVGLAGVLADEATEAVETARHFHRYVAALMPQIAATVVMAVGMLAITGFAAKDVGGWLTSPVGQQFLLLLAVLTAALCARVLAPAWRASR
ncbi:type II secretion system F family protein [Candidatus Poriferisocius sp.]|uniref:type II secretion system F family protein n=1 Tax=Candidatus Poriferisocius sp. TaxID=3101276 RepID=UPI003B029440